jgi:hypothetical protein
MDRAASCPSGRGSDWRECRLLQLRHIYPEPVLCHPGDEWKGFKSVSTYSRLYENIPKLEIDMWLLRSRTTSEDLTGCLSGSPVWLSSHQANLGCCEAQRGLKWDPALWRAGCSALEVPEPLRFGFFIVKRVAMRIKWKCGSGRPKHQTGGKCLWLLLRS